MLLRDATFRSCQTSAPFILGSGGAVLLLAIGMRRQRRPEPAEARERRFWTAFVVCVIPVAVASFGERDGGGAAHVVLQPFVLMATTALAAFSADWGSLLRAVAAASRAFDAALGIGLQAWITSYPVDLPNARTGPFGLRLLDLMIGTGELNWMTKGTLTFLGDRVAAWHPVLALLLAALLPGRAS